MLESHLATYIPQVVNNGRYLFIINFQIFPENMQFFSSLFHTGKA